MNYGELVANMSMKIHFLYSNLANSPENCGDFSDEQGKRFRQDIKGEKYIKDVGIREWGQITAGV